MKLESKLNQCKCGKPKTRFEVKIKNEVREYFVCWPCYDKMMASKVKAWREENRRSRERLAKSKGETYA